MKRYRLKNAMHCDEEFELEPDGSLPTELFEEVEEKDGKYKFSLMCLGCGRNTTYSFTHEEDFLREQKKHGRDYSYVCDYCRDKLQNKKSKEISISSPSCEITGHTGHEDSLVIKLTRHGLSVDMPTSLEEIETLHLVTGKFLNSYKNPDLLSNK